MVKKNGKSGIDALRHAHNVTKTLYDIANSVNTSTSLDHLYKAIHESLKKVMDVKNFFIAIVDSEKRTLYFPYHTDEEDDDFKSITDFDSSNSLTGLVVEKAVPIILKQEQLRERNAQKGVWGPVPKIWLGAPLKIKGEVIGVVAVQSYTDPDCYDRKDIDLLSSVSDQIAVAIDKKRYEKRLEKSENKFTKLFQTTPCWCLLAKMRTGEILEANDTFFKTSGYSRQEVIGKTGFEFGLFVNSKDRQKALDEFDREGRLHDFPIQFRLKNGSVRDCLWSTQMFSVDDEECWLSAVLDITERKKAESERQRANQLAAEQEKNALVGQVAGKMAHDFNNILGAIMGNTELALLDCEDPGLKETLNLILGQTVRGKNLTKNLTAFAKNQEPKHESFSINDTVDLVTNLLKKDLEDITLIKDYEHDIPELIADPGMIEHTLMNLVQNSVHALSKTKKSQITIQTFSEGNHICLKVADNGCGIPKAHMSNIFDPSFSLKGSNDKTGSYASHIKGTGYGMSNVMRYIDQHRGGVYVESEAGRGTTIVVRLPLIHKALTQKEKEELASSRIVSGKTILLVEDEPAISSIQYRILTQSPCDHRVDLAENGREALDFLKKNHYDLVSLDYQLPGKISGLDIYNKIKKMDPALPILFVSGNLEFLESIDILRQQPHIDYLSKPCGNKEYIQAINRLLI